MAVLMLRGTSNFRANITTTTMVATGQINALSFNATSDVIFKENIVTIPNALDKVNAMRGVYYDMKCEPGCRRVGVIAQEIEEIFPEVVYETTDATKTVAYGNIVGPLIESIKELSSKNDALETEMEDVKKKNADLETTVKNMQQQIACILQSFKQNGMTIVHRI